MSLYDRLGGEPALAAAVTGLYRRLTSDPRVARFFEHLDLAELMQKQQAFLAFATGGAESYGGGELRAAHAPLIRRGLSDDHFDATLEHLAATLDDLGVPVAEQREAAARVESVRDEILGR